MEWVSKEIFDYIRLSWFNYLKSLAVKENSFSPIRQLTVWLITPLSIRITQSAGPRPPICWVRRFDCSRFQGLVGRGCGVTMVVALKNFDLSPWFHYSGSGRLPPRSNVKMQNFQLPDLMRMPSYKVVWGWYKNEDHVLGISWLSVGAEISWYYWILKKGRLRPLAVCEMLL